MALGMRPCPSWFWPPTMLCVLPEPAYVTRVGMGVVFMRCKLAILSI